MLVSLAEVITSELQTLNKVMENQYEYTEKFSKYIQLNSKAKEFRKIDCIELRVVIYDYVDLFGIDWFICISDLFKRMNTISWYIHCGQR